MIHSFSRRAPSRLAGVGLSILAVLLAPGPRAEAQCTLLAAPAKFDPPTSGLPGAYFQFQARTLALSAGGATGAKRLAVRYNYGFLVYSLASPAAPARISIEDLLGGDGYPKSGDGQSRVGPVVLSADGQRALQPWTDVAGYGTVAMTQATSGGYSSSGDYLPTGRQVYALSLVKTGSRYIAFSFTGSGVYAADITNYTGNPGPSSKNAISAELIAGTSSYGPVGMASVEAAQAGDRAYVVAWSGDGATVTDVTDPGPAGSGLTAGFTTRKFTAAELGVPSGSTISALAAARHPSTGALYIVVEAGGFSGQSFVSTGLALSRVPASGSPVQVGSYQPPATARIAQSEIALVAYDTDLVAFFLEGNDAGALVPHVHAGTDFAKNLAETIPAFATGLAKALSLAAIRGTGGSLYFYAMDSSGTYAGSLDCSTAPTPAAASLSVDKIAYSGGTVTAVPDGGSVFIGDQLRIKPAYTPPDNIQPLVDWRLDYDFHDGNTLDSQASAMRLLNADESRTKAGNALPPSSYTLVGPCDPALVPQGGSAPVPSTGAGCWASVTTNDTYAVAPSTTADFSSSAPVDKQLTIAFEAQNALNAGGSSVAKHRITWKVPRQGLASTAMLSGGGVTDASEGSPDTTGFRWYFAHVPTTDTGADVLTLEPGCTGPTCTPNSFTQAGQTVAGLQRPGSYRYWVSVPYRGGFRTPECPGLLGDQVTCSGDAAKLVNVTDVVLAFTAPTSVLVGNTITLSSTSKKAGSVAACSGFTYDLCQDSGGTCAEGGYTGSGLATPTDPFATNGSVTIPNPGAGTWGIRVRYSYSTSGNCTSPTVAQWPSSGYAPLVVLNAVPSIRLRNSSDTADLTQSMGIYWETTTGTTVRPYAELNGVRDANPPAGLRWTYRKKNTTAETTIGSTQGASFSISTAGDYEVILRGYGSDVFAQLGVSAPPVGGGGGSGGSSGTSPVVYSVTASNYAPSTGESVTFSCSAVAGSAAITSYDWVLESGVTRSTSSASTAYTYTTPGTKTFACTANASDGRYSNQVVGSLTVSGNAVGNCSFVINNAQGQRISYYQQRYDADGGQPLTFVASGVDSAVSWNFGDGGTATGNPATHTYTPATPASYTVTMTSGSCTSTAAIDITPPLGPTFTVSDADTGLALANPTGSAWEARAGQRLKFNANGVVGPVFWLFGDGETSTEASPVKTYSPAVDTTFVASLSNNGQTKTGNVAVKGSTGAPLTGNYTFKYTDGTTVNRAAVEPNKGITFTGADLATTYTWDFGDGSSLGAGSPTEHFFNRGGTFTVKLTVARTGVAGTATTAAPLAFTVKAPPDPLLWVAAGMAYADGAGGAVWQSDLSIFNPGTQTSTISLGFVAGSSWDGASKVTWIQQALVAGETKSYTNVLETLFRLSKPAWGVVLVRGDNVPVSPVIVGRTYNAALAGTVGTFGLSVPAMSVANGVKPQSASGANVLAGLRHDDAFRTNITIANLKDEEAQVEIVFRDYNGNPIGVPAKLTVEPRGVKQLNSALSAAPDSPIGGAGYETATPLFSAEVQIKKGTGVYPYATVIDTGTNDSIVVTPAAKPSPTYRLPGVVRTATWRSDVVLLNPSAKVRKVKLSYSWIRSGTTARQTLTSTLTFQPWQTVLGVDFVKIWLESQGLQVDDAYDYVSSYLDVTPAADDAAPTEPLLVTGKTYTVSTTGTSGLQVDPYVFEDGIGAQASSKRILMSGLESDADYRTNVALLLTPGAGASDTAEVDVNVYDFLGRKLRSIWVQLTADKPIAQLSSDELFGGLTTTDSQRAAIVINNPRGAARVGAYATVIDRKSLDATFVAGQPVP